MATASETIPTMSDPPDPNSGVSIDISDPLDNPDEARQETTVNPCSSTPTLTELKFIVDKPPNCGTLDTKCRQLLQKLFKDTGVLDPKIKCIFPIDANSSKPPISMDMLVNKGDVNTYLPHQATDKYILCKMNVILPTQRTLGQLKAPGTLQKQNLESMKAFWTTTKLQSFHVETPLFLFNLPVEGIDLDDMATLLAKVCKIDTDKHPIFLQAGNRSMQKVTARVIFLKCLVTSAETVIDLIMEHLPTYQRTTQDFSHPITRAQVMLMSKKYHRTHDTKNIVVALEAQRRFLSNIETLVYLQGKPPDEPFLINGQTKTLRQVLHGLTYGHKHIVHNIVYQEPNKLKITITKTNDVKSYFSNTLQKIVEHLENKEFYHSLLGTPIDHAG